MKKKKNEESFIKRNKKLFEKAFLFFSIVILIFTFSKAYNTAFDKKINLGGDNVYYYILGKSLATGQGYTNILNKEMKPHNHFPIGYPWIVAATLKLSPYSITKTENNINLIKRLNGAFLLLSVLMLFLIFYKLSGNYYLPFITSLFLLVNFHLLYYSTIMMSEIPFMFFSALTLWLFLVTDFSRPLQKNWLFFLLIMVLSFTYYLRSTGLALFAGIILFLLFKKRWKYLLTLIGGFVLLALPWYIRTKNLGGNPYVKQLMRKNPYRPELGQMEFIDWFKRIWNNIERYTTREIPSGIFDFILTKKHTDPIATSEWIIGIVIAIVIVFGVIRLKKHAIIIFFYLLAFFGVLLLWPNEWFGVRFVLPLIPLLSFLFLYGFSEMLILAGQKFFKLQNNTIIYISLVIISLATITTYAKEPLNKLERQSKGMYDKRYARYFEVAKYVKENTPDSSITVCRKGELFFLFSQKFVTNYKYTLNEEEQIEFLKSKHADYVVFDNLGYSSTNRYLYPAMVKYPGKFKELLHLKDPDTHLFKFTPDNGYTGEWKDGQKNGKGVYVYQNGHKYDGEWKDNKRNGFGKYSWLNGKYFEGEWKNEWRNGKGIIYQPGLDYFEGTWVNDTLSGLVIHKNKEGKILDKSIYKDNIKISTIK